MNDHSDASSPMLEVVVPVFDEEETLERSVRELHRYLARAVDVPWAITIADNGSTDATPRIAEGLARGLDRVRLVRVTTKGRGGALKTTWLASSAQVVAYVDVDLSTDLRALPPLVAPLLSGHSDVAIGTRLAAGSRVTRGPKRELVSRAYNFLLRRSMGVRFSDAQCGFKAMRTDVARRLLPLVQDTGWFFDTELLVLAERAGLRIHEVPVDWVDDERSSVDLVATAITDLRGMARVGRGLASGAIPLEDVYAALGRRPFEPPRPPTFLGQVVRFAVIGGLSTLAYGLLYLLLQALLPAQVANFAALLLTAVANTAANRRFTFGVRGRLGAVRHQFQGFVVFGLAWAITSGSLVLLHLVQPGASVVAELVTLTVANLVATVLRFVLLRLWVFRRERADAADPLPATREPMTTREALLAERDDEKASVE